MKITAFVAAVAFAAALGFAPPAQAAGQVSAVASQGLQSNGIKLQSKRLNGINLQGTKFQGFRVNGMNLQAQELDVENDFAGFDRRSVRVRLPQR